MQLDRIYEESRGRVVGLLRSADLSTPVGACPGWTVGDVVRHLVGLAADLVAGRTEAMPPTAAWTGRQVTERRGRAVDELVAEWDELVPSLLPVLTIPPVLDIQTHEHDIRDALGEAPADYDFALQMYVAGLHHRLRKAGLPAVRVRAGDEEWEVGDGPPAVIVTANRYDLFRALAGRPGRLDWDGDPTPYLPLLSPFA